MSKALSYVTSTMEMSITGKPPLGGVGRCVARSQIFQAAVTVLCRSKSGGSMLGKLQPANRRHIVGRQLQRKIYQTYSAAPSDLMTTPLLRRESLIDLGHAQNQLHIPPRVRLWHHDRNAYSS